MQVARGAQSTRRAAASNAPTEPGPVACPVTRPDHRAEATPASPLSPWTLVEDKYRLKRPLGRGGMAEVLLAHDLALDRDVALKFLGTSLLGDPDWRERFLTEARSMARVHHPNVAQIFAFGVHAGRPYFAMELVRGATLAEWIRATPQPSLAQVADIVEAVAQGLHAIHSAGLAHHDIKPTNILIGDDGRIVVSDLGLARLADGVSRSGVSGTLHYMAPEQFAPRSLRAGTLLQTDVYQLGITVYEMLAGAVPFSGEDARSIIRRHRSGSIPPITTVRPDLEQELEAVLAKALAKDPADRFASAIAFSQALTELAPVRPSARPSGVTPRRKLRILVAEDDDFLRSAMCATIATAFSAEAEVDAVEDGDAAKKAIANKRYDILVLDQHMPGCTGLEVAAAAACSQGAPRMILVTAEGGAEEWRTLRNLGGDMLLLKPLDADQLVDSIHRCASLLTGGARMGAALIPPSST